MNTLRKSTILRDHVKSIEESLFALDQRHYWIFCIIGHVSTLMSKCILLQEFTNGCIVFHRFQPFSTISSYCFITIVFEGSANIFDLSGLILHQLQNNFTIQLRSKDITMFTSSIKGVTKLSSFSGRGI